MDRLAQIMAGIGEKARFGLVGLLSALMLARQFGKLGIEASRKAAIRQEETVHPHRQNAERSGIQDDHAGIDDASRARVEQDVSGSQSQQADPDADKTRPEHRMLRRDRAQRRTAKRKAVEKKVLER